MNYQEFIKPELLILIPVLYFIGMGVKRSVISNTLIPLILGVTGILLSGIYLFAAEPINGSQAVFTAIFTAITQGVLCAAAAVYTNQILKQASKEAEETKRENNEHEDIDNGEI